jgi:signal transduction histidine kinase/CheY-like chemotaxis protein
MSGLSSPPTDAVATAQRAGAQGARRDAIALREFAARQRTEAAEERRKAAQVREEAAHLRAEAAQVRDLGARTRDDAARVRDQAAMVRDQAAQARAAAMRTRDEATRLRVLRAPPLTRSDWAELFEFDRVASEHGRDASARDREAATLDRQASEKDREAAERDREAASSDRLAADRDRDAADQDRAAAEKDREAADVDRTTSEHELALAEQRLTRSERLAVLGRVSAGVAHELNSPLTTLQANLSVLEELLAARAPAEVVEILADLRLSTKRIVGVVDDMRLWVRGGTQSTERAPLDVAALVQEAVKLSAYEVEGRAAVKVEVGPLPLVWGVGHRLGQVFVNLIVNAAHAMPEGRAGNQIVISAAAADGDVRVDVRDNGVGIAPEVLPHLFDPFFTTRESEGGTGLGLAMCEQILTDHGADIAVESTLGVGTVFHVRLPVNVEPRPSDAPPHRPRVLLIDDDAALTRSLVRQLRGGCDVTTAADGRAGLAQLLSPGASFDLVLCDLSMPVMNGRQLFEQLRHRAPDLAERIVFITGGALNQETADFLAALPNTKLLKPFGRRELLDLLETRVAPARVG